MCRWWSGCTDSWRVQSGRPRRTKPRDWCSFGRWDAGPSDNLCSEKGETRRAEPGSEKGEKNSEADPSLPLQSLDLLANQRQHSELSLSFFFFLPLGAPFFSLALRESE